MCMCVWLYGLGVGGSNHGQPIYSILNGEFLGIKLLEEKKKPRFRRKRNFVKTRKKEKK